jgi:hypothetical protein
MTPIVDQLPRPGTPRFVKWTARFVVEQVRILFMRKFKVGDRMARFGDRVVIAWFPVLVGLLPFSVFTWWTWDSFRSWSERHVSTLFAEGRMGVSHVALARRSSFLWNVARVEDRAHDCALGRDTVALPSSR